MSRELEKIGFKLSDGALIDKVHKDVKKKHPHLSEKEVIIKRNIKLKEKTLYHDDNKGRKK